MPSLNSMKVSEAIFPLVAITGLNQSIFRSKRNHHSIPTLGRHHPFFSVAAPPSAIADRRREYASPSDIALWNYYKEARSARTMEKESGRKRRFSYATVSF